MTDTVDNLGRLNMAISLVSREVLICLLWKICETDSSARDFVKDRLFVNEQEVPQPGTPPDTDGEYGEDSDASDDNEKEDARPPPATATGPKRLRTRYAGCINCKEEFDVSTNTKTSCSYHSAHLEPDYDMWPDHDENCHGPIDSEDNRRDYPESFVYICCDRHGDEEPCVTDWHREHEYDYETSKRQKF